jgi:hypothetical protein
VEVEERTVPGSLVALVGWRGRTGPPPAMEAPLHEVTAMEAQSTYLPLSLAGHHEGASGDGGRGRRDLVLVTAWEVRGGGGSARRSLAPRERPMRAFPANQVIHMKWACPSLASRPYREPNRPKLHTSLARGYAREPNTPLCAETS